MVLVLSSDDKTKVQTGFCLRKDHRLLTPRAFAEVLDKRLSGRSRYFRYSIAPNNLGIPRLGITVSRKVSKLAAQRNRIKRQLKEYFRHNRQKTCGYDLVVMSIAGTADKSNKEIQNDLRQLWSQLEKRLSLS